MYAYQQIELFYKERVVGGLDNRYGIFITIATVFDQFTPYFLLED